MLFPGKQMLELAEKLYEENWGWLRRTCVQGHPVLHKIYACPLFYFNFTIRHGRWILYHFLYYINNSNWTSGCQLDQQSMLLSQVESTESPRICKCLSPNLFLTPNYTCTTPPVDVTHKTIPHKLGIMINNRVIYLRGNLTDHCPRQQPSARPGTVT